MFAFMLFANRMMYKIHGRYATLLVSMCLLNIVRKTLEFPEHKTLKPIMTNSIVMVFPPLFLPSPPITSLPLGWTQCHEILYGSI